MGTQSDRLRRGEWYLDEEDLREARRDCWRLLDRFNALGADDDVQRRRVLGLLLSHVGDGAVVMPRFQCSYGYNISLGSGSFVNSNAFFMDDAPVSVDPDARLGPGVQLMTALHPMEDDARRRQGWERAAPISIESNAWLGAGVIVCPGVTVGRDSVVGAGSVVKRDVSSGVFVAGNPAVFIRTLK